MKSKKEIDLYTHQLLFQKIQKVFDIKNYKIIKSKYRIKELKHKLECIISKKKRKINTSPNSKFSGIKTIYQTQIETSNREIDRIDSNSIYEINTTEDCIVVG